MENLTLMTDLYQLTMMQGYFNKNKAGQTAVFDLFFRTSDYINYAVAAGLEQAVKYVQNLKFSAEDIRYLGGLKLFSKEFLDYLKAFKFSGEIRAVPEGTVVFPGEPILIVKAPILEAQLIETALLTIINHQTLIATKASRIVFAADGAAVAEFGLRRAQGPDAGVYGARAAIIGGCNSTSNVLAAKLFKLNIKGTHSHSWVLSFDSEEEAFQAYADAFPDNCLLLVDTYDTLNSGLPKAIKVFDRLRASGHEPIGIRLDSGDLAYLSKRCRKVLDDAGYPNAIIMASGDVDENIIINLKIQGAKIDAYGVGTKLITGDNMPSIGCVYKLSAIGQNGEFLPKMKISNTPAKMTLPGEKELYRIYDQNSEAVADLIALKDESLQTPLTLTHPVDRWKQLTLDSYKARKLLISVFEEGRLVYELPDIDTIAQYARGELDALWPEYKRLINPHLYKVDLSDDLYNLRQNLIASTLTNQKT